jgi:hypothetical protein
MSRPGKKQPWPPVELCLPNVDELERLSRLDVAEQQRELFPNRPDDSRAGRLSRLLASVGTTTADRLEATS